MTCLLHSTLEKIYTEVGWEPACFGPARGQISSPSFPSSWRLGPCRGPRDWRPWPVPLGPPALGVLLPLPLQMQRCPHDSACSANAVNARVIVGAKG